MLSKMPIRLEDTETNDIDKEILRAGVIGGYDAISNYIRSNGKGS